MWNITPCNPLNAKQETSLKQTWNRTSLAGFFLSFLFSPEDGGDMFLRNVGWLSVATTWSYIPERIVHNHRCENLKAYLD
jgi:hypothetical protein